MPANGERATAIAVALALRFVDVDVRGVVKKDGRVVIADGALTEERAERRVAAVLHFARLLAGAPVLHVAEVEERRVDAGARFQELVRRRLAVRAIGTGEIDPRGVSPQLAGQRRIAVAEEIDDGPVDGDQV